MKIIRRVSAPSPVATVKVKKKQFNRQEDFIKRQAKNHWQSPREGYLSVWLDKTLCADHPSVKTSSKV